MRKDTQSMIKGAAVGVLAGAAVGAAGTYMAKTNPKQMKKMLHKAAKAGEQVVHNVEHMLSSY